MKNITFFKKRMLGNIAVAILMLTGSFAWSQVTVQVPAQCRVVVAGVGGTLGFGPTGKVGAGGVVVMPDPFDDSSTAGNFILSGLPAGSTINGWSLAGDISVQTTTTSGSAVQSAASVSTVNIQSYNKRLRPSESVAPSTSDLARSKGRVTISYTGNACGQAISFDIFKSYSTNVPNIVGPGCLLPDTEYTFSVDQVGSDNADDAIGFDKYYWTGLPPYQTNTLYYSADGSSITFKTIASLTPSTWTLKCSFGRANPWDNGISVTAANTTTTFVTKTIGSTPLPPSYTINPSTLQLSTTTPGCISTGSSAFTISYPAPALGTTYTWTAPGTDWNIQSATVSGTVTLTVSNIGNNSGSLVLSIDNNCGNPVEYTYKIHRIFTNAITITSALTCLTPGGAASSFSIGPNASVNTANWTITPTPSSGSFSITTNTPTTTATIATTANITPGAYTLTATSVSCGGSISIPIYVRPSAPVFTTSTTTPVGTSQACVQRNGGPSVTYSVTPVIGATAYVWTFPSGWLPSTTTTATNTVTITPNGNTASGNVIVQAVSGSGCNSATAAFPVSYRAVAPGAISTNSCFNVGRSSAVSVNIPLANVPSPFFGSYTATLISTVTGSTTNYAAGSAVFSSPNTVTFNTTNTATGTASPPPGTYNLVLTHNGSCGSAAASTAYVVTINSPTPAPAITAQYNSNGGICDQFTLINNPNGGGTGITWYVNGTVAASGGNVNIFLNTLTICGSTPATSVWADVTVTPTAPACPYIVRVFAVPGTHGLRQATSNSQNLINNGISIYPNPSTGNFSIQVDHFNEAASATISDTAGKQIGTYNLQIGENRIENLNVAQGTYIVLLTVDGQTESRKIIIK